MPAVTGVLFKWPLIRQIRERATAREWERCRTKRAPCMRGLTTRQWRARLSENFSLSTLWMICIFNQARITLPRPNGFYC
jgi:hypothetical protein